MQHLTVRKIEVCLWKWVLERWQLTNYCEGVG